MGSSPTYPISLFYYEENLFRKKVNVIKEISKQEIETLVSKGVIRNTNNGYVNVKGSEVGFYRTKGVGRKRYIQDKYVDMLRDIK